jgi:hypothetical protein
MTQHVRQGYRDHRRAGRVLALAVVGLVAAIAIPLATGTGTTKHYYTLAVSPTQIACAAGQTQTFTLTLTNKSNIYSIGSADITAPSMVELVSGSLSGAPSGSSIAGNAVKLRNLVVKPGHSLTVTVGARVESAESGTWSSTVKRTKDFSNYLNPNLFTLKGSAPSLSVSTCTYEFVEGPTDAEKGSPQPVRVQLQSGGQPVPVNGPLTLSALQNDSTADSSFEGLTADPDASGALAGKQWTFSITGSRSGSGYTLQAGGTTSDPFAIVDGLCDPYVTDPEHLSSSCSLTSSFTEGPQAGVTIDNHELSPISITFVPGSAATGKCSPWKRASYTVTGQTFVFPGVELDFSWGAGMLQVIYRLRNRDWVLTKPPRGNQDIEVCVGAKHGIDTSLNKDETAGGVPFVGKYGKAKWSQSDGLFWGVLSTVPNPGKVKKDPAVCARGSQELLTGNGGTTMETWRTWTICIPSDWDWKNFG